jgi:hypothetical protein
MTACAMQTFNNVTPSAWQSIKQAVAGYDIEITTDSGTATKDGLTIEWNHSEQNGLLSIQCLAYPWPANCSYVNGKIHDAIEACLAPHNIAVTRMGSPWDR